MAAAGIGFEAVTPEVEELRDGAAPESLVLENARRKARAGLRLGAAGEGDWSLGVDTEVVLEGRLLGKAASEGEARQRLEALSGRTHEVLGGVVLATVGQEPSPEATELGLGRAGAERSGVASTLVTFTDLSHDTVERYLASGEWRDRAGAYAIQGLGSLLVGRLEGDFSNVVGLPLGLLMDLAPELFGGISNTAGL